MKAIKALVAVMTLLLVAGLGILGWGLSNQAARLGGGKGASLASDAFGTTAVPLPAGARVEQVLAAGDRVVLRVTGGGPDRLLVLDPASGAVFGSFVITVEAPR